MPNDSALDVTDKPVRDGKDGPGAIGASSALISGVVGPLRRKYSFILLIVIQWTMPDSGMSVLLHDSDRYISELPGWRHWRAPEMTYIGVASLALQHHQPRVYPRS